MFHLMKRKYYQPKILHDLQIVNKLVKRNNGLSRCGIYIHRCTLLFITYFNFLDYLLQKNFVLQNCTYFTMRIDIKVGFQTFCKFVDKVTNKSNLNCRLSKTVFTLSCPCIQCSLINPFLYVTYPFHMP